MGGILASAKHYEYYKTEGSKLNQQNIVDHEFKSNGHKKLPFKLVRAYKTGF